MDGAERANRETVLESITLVFSHSKLKEVVGTDALKSVLSGQYRDLVSQGTLHLQVVWDLLADQPGFEEDHALAPFCVLKTWESDLGLVVEMPKSLAHYTATETIAQASHCPIPKNLKDRTIRAEELRAKAREVMAQVDAHTPAPGPSAPSTRKPAAEAALALVAVLGLAYGGYALYSNTDGPGFQSVQTSDIRTELPVSKAKQLGAELNLVVEEESWYELPADARKDALRKTLENSKVRKVTSVVVQDSSGKVRASAQWVGDPERIVVRLQ